MRGKHCRRIGRSGFARITPAGAGKTEFAPLSVHVTEDHPRRCGENLNIAIYVLKDIGSPPQVRGKQLAELGEIPAVRITPAGAGKT